MARARALGKTARATGARCATARASATASADVVNVDLGDRSYPIYIGSGLLDDGEALRAHVAGSTALVVTNETIAGLGYLDRAVEALRAGTIEPARSLGMERDIGSLEVGKLADLLVLSADPSENIRNSDKIDRVMLGGRLYDARTMNEVETGNARRLPYWWE